MVGPRVWTGSRVWRPMERANETAHLEDVHDPRRYVGGPDGEVDWFMPTLDVEATAWIEETLW